MEELEQGSDQRIAAEAMRRPLEERTVYLDRTCGVASEMRDRVQVIMEGILGNLGAVSGLQNEPTTIDRQAPGASESPGYVIGNYKLLQPIGEGGFGSVYMAEQLHPVQRKVALKIIKLGMDTRQVIARFEAERQALAMMDHPNIAKVLDAGATETGRPYFVMELVHGMPINEYCDKNKLSTPERLKLFVQVCHAVQHAHQKGIIHRDIKPTNILVTMADGIPIPKVIDFGIAKATQSPLTDKTLFTEYRQMMGTPEYMSPEQAEMAGIDIDTRSDIYSLGVLLYELLTGTTPFDGREFRSKPASEIQRIIREVDPPCPSIRLSTLGPAIEAVAAHRRTDGQKLGRLLRGEVDWIVMRCLEKDRTRRYQTATALAVDVLAHLNDDTVSASPPSAAYRLQKLARRHKGMFAAMTAVVLALFIGLSAATVGLIRARSERDRALRAQRAEFEQRQIADRERARAEQRFNDVRALANVFIFQIHDEIQHLQGSTRARELLVTSALKYLDSLSAEAVDNRPLRLELALAYERIGDIQGGPSGANLGDTDGALASYEKARDILGLLVGAGDGKTARYELAVTLDKLGDVYIVMGNIRAAMRVYEQSFDLRQRLEKEDSGKVEFQRAVSASYQRLGSAGTYLGKSDDALRHYHKSLEINQNLARLAPADWHTQRLLALAYERVGSANEALGRTGDASRAYETAFATLKAVADAQPLNTEAQRDLSICHERLGDMQVRAGNFAAALELYAKSLGIRQKMADADAPNARAQRDLAVAHARIGDALDCEGNAAQALKEFQAALEINARLAAIDRLSVAAQLASAFALGRIADMQMKLGRSGDVGVSYEKALRITARLANDYPDHPDVQRDLAANYERAAEFNQGIGKPGEALAMVQKSVEIRQSLSAKDPGNVPIQRELAGAYALSSKLLRAAGRVQESVETGAQAAAIEKKVSIPQLTATVTGVRGLVQLRLSPEQPWQNAKVGMTVNEFVEFRTGIRSAVTLLIPPDQNLTVDRLGTVKLLGMLDASGKVRPSIEMLRGRTEYRLEGDYELEITVPGARLSVRG